MDNIIFGVYLKNMINIGNVSDVLVVNYCITHLQIINDLY